MKKSVILIGLLFLIVAIGALLTGCGSNEKETISDPMITEIVVTPIEVNPIQVETILEENIIVETIETETILWENVKVTTWD